MPVTMAQYLKEQNLGRPSAWVWIPGPSLSGYVNLNKWFHLWGPQFLIFKWSYPRVLSSVKWVYQETLWSLYRNALVRQGSELDKFAVTLFHLIFMAKLLLLCPFADEETGAQNYAPCLKLHSEQEEERLTRNPCLFFPIFVSFMGMYFWKKWILQQPGVQTPRLQPGYGFGATFLGFSGFLEAQGASRQFILVSGIWWPINEHRGPLSWHTTWQMMRDF